METLLTGIGLFAVVGFVLIFLKQLELQQASRRRRTKNGFSSPIPSPSEKKWKDRVKRGILLPGGLGQRPGRMSRYLRMIETRDPEFDPEGFLKRVRKAYLRIQEARNSRNWESVYTFIRRPAARTSSGPGLLEGICPNCGAPSVLKDSARCESCGSLLNDARHHWILGAVRAEAVR